MVEFLQEERKRQHVSIKTLSKLSGVGEGTIGNWIYCGFTPTLDNFQKVLNALGYDLSIVKKENGI
ncbi:MAG: helix-turn-helix transcriptional regulator [Clostridia bacterium]|jgi:transcriptional regulator with XRE-family HTH domain|nr:helix-turn-helix transcriptional regulator [Clostridia bacterium]